MLANSGLSANTLYTNNVETTVNGTLYVANNNASNFYLMNGNARATTMYIGCATTFVTVINVLGAVSLSKALTLGSVAPANINQLGYSPSLVLVGTPTSIIPSGNTRSVAKVALTSIGTYMFFCSYGSSTATLTPSYSIININVSDSLDSFGNNIIHYALNGTFPGYVATLSGYYTTANTTTTLYLNASPQFTGGTVQYGSTIIFNVVRIA